MGERHSGDGLPGRRHAHPGGILSTPRHADADLGASAFEERLGAALRADGVDPEAERGAVAAFRAAREAGAQRPRTRPRDDWRPAAPRAPRRSLKTVLSVAFASLTLGGVAVAAIGSAGYGTDSGRDAPRPAHPSASAPRRATADPSGGPTGAAAPAPSDAPSTHPPHPATAGDTLAHCRAFEKAGGHGHALDATAWQRLVTAAGGADKVPAYCAAQSAHDRTGNGQSSENGRKSGQAGATSKPTAANAKPSTANTAPADGKK